MEQIINETIDELAAERNCSPHMITWHLIAIRLAEKLNKL